MAKGELKINHHYDLEEDVLYLSLADDEPTFAENVDDILYVEIGCFSGIPKGFRIMSPKKNQMSEIIGFLVEQLKDVIENRRKELEEEETVLGEAIKKQLPDLLLT